ncbi:MAG TPA: glycosyltransferase family 2 protein, partial [Bacteroidales bacterium]|nr:glycosyltransferase family 2 protein [Bacteroidales bacterium]
MPHKKQEISEAMNWCVIIPTYNNGKTLGKVLQEVLLITPNIIVVNDGSTDQTDDILERFPVVTSISYAVNKGKGYALRKGFEKAADDGFDYAVTLDSDGQHFSSDIPLLIKKAEDEPGSLIVGARTLEGKKLRQGSGFANKFSNFWFRIISGVGLPDTQSGFRLYPLKPLNNLKFYTNRYEFELEVLYRAAWKGVKLLNVPINVFYPDKNERISHFRPFRDFSRISVLNAICFFVAF